MYICTHVHMLARGEIQLLNLDPVLNTLTVDKSTDALRLNVKHKVLLIHCYAQWQCLKLNTCFSVTHSVTHEVLHSWQHTIQFNIYICRSQSLYLYCIWLEKWDAHIQLHSSSTSCRFWKQLDFVFALEAEESSWGEKGTAAAAVLLGDSRIYEFLDASAKFSANAWPHPLPFLEDAKHLF